jgi:hypothetical protein
MMTHKKALKFIKDYVDYMKAEVTATDEELAQWREVIAALEAAPSGEPLAEINATAEQVGGHRVPTYTYYSSYTYCAYGVNVRFSIDGPAYQPDSLPVRVVIYGLYDA